MLVKLHAWFLASFPKKDHVNELKWTTRNYFENWLILFICIYSYTFCIIILSYECILFHMKELYCFIIIARLIVCLLFTGFNFMKNSQENPPRCFQSYLFLIHECVKKNCKFIFVSDNSIFSSSRLNDHM